MFEAFLIAEDRVNYVQQNVMVYKTKLYGFMLIMY